MPKLSPQCERDVDRYVELRFSHWSSIDREKRKKATKMALSKLDQDGQEDYSRNVDELFDKNSDFLESCERSKQRLMFESRRLIRESVSEALRGNNNKQH